MKPRPTLRYKLTDADGRTHGDTQWAVGVTHTASGIRDLCGPGWIHVYPSPVLAVLLNPIHANFPSPRLWQVACQGRSLDDHGLKQGWTSVTVTAELPRPQVTTAQRARFAILCAQAVYRDPAWQLWAEGWLLGRDRTRKAAWAAAWAGVPLDLVALAEQAMREEKA